MKSEKKGFAIIDDLIALSILSSVIFAILVSPVVYLQIPITNVIQFEDKYNTADLAMLTLLSLKNNGKDMIEILSNHLAFNNPSDISFLNQYLDKIVPSKCYELKTVTSTQSSTQTTATTTSTSTTSQQNPSINNFDIKSSAKDCTPDTTSSVEIILPYNPNKLTETLELSIS